MSSSNQYPIEELPELRPWDLPDMSPKTGNRRSLAIEEDLNHPPRLTVDEIEQMQRQAYEESANKGRKDGYKNGYEDGFQAAKKEGFESGFQEGDAAAKEQAQRFEALVKTLDKPFRELDHQVEQELVALAIAISKQIIRRELKIDSGQVVSVVREAMQILPAAARKVRLNLHPEDAKLVKSALALDDDAPDWTIIEDPLLTRGGCVVDSQSSRIDASVEKRLAAVIASVFGGERGDDRTP